MTYNDLWLMQREKDENPAIEDAIQKTIRWNLSGCPRCLAIYDTLGMVPVQCSTCGERNHIWINWIEMAAGMMAKGTLVIRES